MKNALDAENDRAKLAAALGFVVASKGSPLVVTGSELAKLPEDAKLHEHYDPETDTYTFSCVVPKKEPQKILLVTDEISPVEAVHAASRSGHTNGHIEVVQSAAEVLTSIPGAATEFLSER
jgi:hypothetical protein